jgi:hypothetical protein
VKLRLLAVVIVALLMYISYAVSELHKRELGITQADYQRCVIIRNGPLRQSRGAINGGSPQSEVV